MPTATYKIGDTFQVQFVWKLPEGDFIRAIFEAEVLYLDATTEKYVLRLRQLLAGRQESASGEGRPVEELSRPYWNMVGKIAGQKISLAFEADDGRPLYLRLSTLTGEHTFFTRLSRIGSRGAQERGSRGAEEGR